tara:strand:+ start:846 stop:1403 length:558 start_codon:yes stop_codon:yes gene_type:complete
MTKSMKILLGVLVLIIVLFFISQSRQKRHLTQSTDIFSITMDKVNSFDILKDTLFISIQRKDTSWQILDNDSLLIQINRINDIENKVLTVQRESIVSNNSKKWKKFNVDDSLGLKLTFYGYNKEILGEAIFGRSSSDWQRSYVRMIDENEVYMTNENVLNRLQLRPTFWGSKPAPPPLPVELDSL